MDAEIYKIEKAEDLLEAFPELDKSDKLFKPLSKVIGKIDGFEIKVSTTNDEGEYIYWGNGKKRYGCKMLLNGKQVNFGRLKVHSTSIAKDDEFGPEYLFVGNYDFENEEPSGSITIDGVEKPTWIARVVKRKRMNWIKIGKLIAMFLDEDWFELTGVRRCDKCGGKGKLAHYSHVMNGDCFRCAATGIDPYQK